MSQKIRLSESDAHADPCDVEPEEYKQFYPALTVLVRDFSLEMKDSDKNTISPNEYLQNAIAEKPGKSQTAIENNFTRAAIRDSFPILNCSVMCRPVDSEKDIRRLNEIPVKQLKPEF